MVKNKFLELLLYKKTGFMLISLKRLINFNKKSINCSLLAKESDCTYSHAVKILKVLSERDLIKLERKGREKIVTLTDKGDELVSYLRAIRNTVQ